MRDAATEQALRAHAHESQRANNLEAENIRLRKALERIAALLEPSPMLGQRQRASAVARNALAGGELSV